MSIDSASNEYTRVKDFVDRIYINNPGLNIGVGTVNDILKDLKEIIDKESRHDARMIEIAKYLSNREINANKRHEQQFCEAILKVLISKENDMSLKQELEHTRDENMEVPGLSGKSKAKPAAKTIESRDIPVVAPAVTQAVISTATPVMNEVDAVKAYVEGLRVGGQGAEAKANLARINKIKDLYKSIQKGKYNSEEDRTYDFIRAFSKENIAGNFYADLALNMVLQQYKKDNPRYQELSAINKACEQLLLLQENANKLGDEYTAISDKLKRSIGRMLDAGPNGVGVKLTELVGNLVKESAKGNLYSKRFLDEIEKSKDPRLSELRATIHSLKSNDAVATLSLISSIANPSLELQSIRDNIVLGQLISDENVERIMKLSLAGDAGAASLIKAIRKDPLLVSLKGRIADIEQSEAYKVYPFISQVQSIHDEVVLGQPISDATLLKIMDLHLHGDKAAIQLVEAIRRHPGLEQLKGRVAEIEKDEMRIIYHAFRNHNAVSSTDKAAKESGLNTLREIMTNTDLNKDQKVEQALEYLVNSKYKHQIVATSVIEELKKTTLKNTIQGLEDNPLRMALASLSEKYPVRTHDRTLNVNLASARTIESKLWKILDKKIPVDEQVNEMIS